MNSFFRDSDKVLIDENNGFRVKYDHLGYITAIYLLDSFTNDYVRVDPEYYEKRFTSRYND